jgi:Papain-like cysteine protease AvrRpt2
VKQRMRVAGVWISLLFSSSLASAMAGELQLHIPPVLQERPGWDWLAVGEMVLKYYAVPAAHRTSYQCGVIKSVKSCVGTSNCAECVAPDATDAAMEQVLTQYPIMATQGGKAGDIALTVQAKNGGLTEAEVKQELTAGRPIIVGLSPPGFAAKGTLHHLALIIGYDDGYGELMVTINDPFPFDDERFSKLGNPYRRKGMSGIGDGQYGIGLEQFRSTLNWTSTFYGIICVGHDCPSDHHRVIHKLAWKSDQRALDVVLAAATEDFKPLRRGHKAADLVAGTTWQSDVVFAGAKQCLVRDKDESHNAEWRCLFMFANRSVADELVKDMLARLHSSVPQGWIQTVGHEVSEAEEYVRIDTFSASKPDSNTILSLYVIESKKDRRVKMYLTVENK